MDPYPYSKSKWMDDYMNFDQAMSEEGIFMQIEETLNSPAYLKHVIKEQDNKINSLEDTIYRLKAPITLKIKWKLASLIDRLPKIRIEW